MSTEEIAALFKGDPAPMTAIAKRALANNGVTPVDVAYFEPRMRDQQGHFATLADTYNAVTSRSGQSFAVFHHAAWQGLDVPGWHRVFPVDDHMVGVGHPVDEQTLAAYRAYLAKVIGWLLTGTAATTAIFPTARFLTLPGIADALVRAEHVQGAIIGVMETWPVPDCDDWRLVASAFEDAARILAEKQFPCLLIAESGPIADWLVARGFDPGDVTVAPYPAASRFAARDGRKDSKSRLHCGAFGAMRPVQNPGLQAAFLTSSDQHNRDWTTKLNIDLAASELGFSRQVLDQALRLKNIRLLPARLSQTAYDEALGTQDVMLLPYGERYETIGSGIFLECISAGVIPLVPETSTMGQLYLELGGAAPLIHRLDLDGIATCLSECEARLEELKQNALSVRETWLDHPMGPRQWQARIREKLLAW